MATTLEEPFVIDGFELFVTASIGAVVYPDHGVDTASLLRNVESATYFAKDSGRNTVQIYSDTVNLRRAGRLDLETELRKALEGQGFTLAYQPRLELATGVVRGMEALLRWTHPRLGPLAPGKFIPVAEESGLIVPIGDVVLNAACLATKNWMDRGFGPLTVAVNLSARQFRDASLVSRIAAALERTRLPPHALEIEITESGLMYEVDRVMDALIDLKSLGVSIAVDDFGMGYSSLGYLKNFPIDVLKIDQSFIQGLPDPGDVAISTAIVAMSKSLKLRVVAEGVETQDQMDFVRDLGCDEVQGFHFSKPLPPDEFALFVQNHRLIEAPFPRGPIN
jgi:EAL domain-containing protein (putative c-di-GMP-specific phosphodiesterase class I)